MVRVFIQNCYKHYCHIFIFVDNFIKQQLHEYNIGKRHLANMMGKDPEFFTQADVDVILDSLCLKFIY